MPRITVFLFSTTAFCTPTSAQETVGLEIEESVDETANESAAGQNYTPADFERFSPTTALDMVRRIPGFVIQQGDNRRGLGQGGDNVLINGERVSANPTML